MEKNGFEIPCGGGVSGMYQGRKGPQKPWYLLNATSQALGLVSPRCGLKAVLSYSDNFFCSAVSLSGCVSARFCRSCGSAMRSNRQPLPQ